MLFLLQIYHLLKMNKIQSLGDIHTNSEVKLEINVQFGRLVRKGTKNKKMKLPNKQDQY